MSEEEKETLSREYDHLGAIEGQLRDLKGYATLAFELIQNADDAPETFEMTFDLREDGLYVDNNGHFRACEDVTSDSQECGFHKLHNRLCDFRKISG